MQILSLSSKPFSPIPPAKVITSTPFKVTINFAMYWAIIYALLSNAKIDLLSPSNAVLSISLKSVDTPDTPHAHTISLLLV